MAWAACRRFSKLSIPACTENVKCGRGFIQQQEPRSAQHGAGDGHALALPPGKLMGIAVPVIRFEAHFRERLVDTAQRLRFPHALDDERLDEDALHRMARVQRGRGILEDHLHLPSERPGEGLSRPQRLSEQRHLPAPGEIQACQNPQQRRFAASRCTRKTVDLALGDAEFERIDHLVLAAQMLEWHGQGTDEEGVHAGRSSRIEAASNTGNTVPCVLPLGRQAHSARV